MIYKSLKKIAVYFFKAVFVVIGLLSVLLLALIVRLHQGPLSLEHFKPALQKNIDRVAPGFVMTVRHPEMIWEGLGHPARIRLHDVEIRRQKDTKTKASIASLSLTYSFASLLTSGLHPEGIEIESPHLTFERDTFLSLFASSQKEEDEDLLLSFVHRILYSAEASSPLEFLEISQAQITLDDEGGWGVWILPPSHVTLKKSKDTFEISAHTTWQSQKFSLLLEASTKSEEVRFCLSVPEFSTDFLENVQSHHIRDLSAQTKKFMNILCRNPLRFSLFLDGYYRRGKGIRRAELQSTLFEGTLDFPDFLPKSLKLQEGRLKAHIDDNLLTIETCDLKSGNSLVKIKGSGVWQPDTHDLVFDLATEAQQVSADSLKDMWPQGLARVTRKWILKNISKAVFTRATCALKGKASFLADKTAFNINGIHGEIEFKDGAVSYMNEFPDVKDVKGIATYDARDFHIQLQQGKSAGLVLKKGRIDIHGLNQKDQTLDMTLDIASSLSDALKFVDQPPLGFARKFNLDKMTYTGNAETSLSMAFPLSTRLTLSQIKAQAAVRLSHVSIVKPVSSLDISVSKGEFDLKVNSDRLLLQGRAMLNDTSADITWERALSDKAPYVTQLNISASLTPFWLKRAGFDVTSYGEGILPTRFQYSEDSARKGRLEVSSDLTRAKLMVLGGVKPFQTKGTLAMVLDFHHDRLQSLKKFSVTAVDGLDIEADGTFDETGKAFESLRLHHFKMGQNQLNGTLKRGGNREYEITLNGKSLDIEPLRKTISEKEFSLPKENVRFKANIEQAYISPQETLFENVLTFYSQNDRLLSFEYSAYFKKIKDKENLIHVVIASRPDHTRRFTLQTPAADKLIKALDIPLQVHGGLLKLYAVRNDMLSHGPWEGKLKIENFSIRNVPALGQILSLAFPTGVMDLFSNKGLSFRQFRTRFTLTPRKIILSKGHAQGVSLGITLQGSMDRSFMHLNLFGSVIPAYLLNSLLSKIPLLGELLTGGKHEGIFSVSYTIQGSRLDPIVSVNPVSIFTPGFLRKIFEFGAEDAESEDNDDSFDFEK